MPSELGWFVDGRVLYVRAWGQITLKTIESESDLIVEALDTDGQEPAVHLMFDSLKLEKFNFPLTTVYSITQKFRTHPLVGWSIDITANSSNQVAGKTMSGIVRTQWRHTSSREEALQVLQWLDETLPPLSMDLFDHIECQPTENRPAET